MTEPVADVVRAKRFELVDSEGQVCATLALGEDGCSALGLCDREGHERATFSLDRGGGLYVTVRTKSGGVFGALGFGTDWRVGLQLLDGNQQVIWSAGRYGG
jgi:hypothetical protein